LQESNAKARDKEYKLSNFKEKKLKDGRIIKRKKGGWKTPTPL